MNEQPLAIHLMDDTDPFHTFMKCPLCMDPNGLHIVGCRINAGGEVTFVDHRGTHRSVSPPVGRGSIITITYACEMCADISEISQHFHKGQVLVSTNKAQTHTAHTARPARPVAPQSWMGVGDTEYEDPYPYWRGWEDIWRD